MFTTRPLTRSEDRPLPSTPAISTLTWVGGSLARLALAGRLRELWPAARFEHYRRATNRYYRSTLRRFISEDPIAIEGGTINFYIYTANNPMAFTDPLGLMRTASGCRKTTFTQKFAESFRLTNDLLLGTPIRFGLTLAGGQAVGTFVSEGLNIPTPFQYLKSGFARLPVLPPPPPAPPLGIGGPATFTALESAILVGAGRLVSVGAALSAFEAGIVMGSAINALLPEICP